MKALLTQQQINEAKIAIAEEEDRLEIDISNEEVFQYFRDIQSANNGDMQIREKDGEFIFVGEYRPWSFYDAVNNLLNPTEAVVHS